jgi:hypothetical protein
MPAGLTIKPILCFLSDSWLGAELRQMRNGVGDFNVKCCNVSTAGSFDALRHFWRHPADFTNRWMRLGLGFILQWSIPYDKLFRCGRISLKPSSVVISRLEPARSAATRLSHQAALWKARACQSPCLPSSNFDPVLGRCDQNRQDAHLIALFLDHKDLGEGVLLLFTGLLSTASSASLSCRSTMIRTMLLAL